jgi:MoxR-like ATPase
MPKITIQEKYGKSKEFPVDKDILTIGRDADCDIVLENSDASRKHARIVREDRKYFIEDLESANGVYLNSVPVVDRHEIKHMDVVQIGSCMLVYNDPDNLQEDRDTKENTKITGTDMYSFDFMKYIIKKLEENIGKVFKGKPEVIRNVVICLFADGHLLLEDAPGVGKSMLAQSLAKSIQGSYKRIQFTPDMLPSDITGMNIYDESNKDFKFMPGPIFGNIVLADEINRTTPRTQSSLLECMAESVVTIDGVSHVMPKPFFVVATQNPDDYHGTYPLPEPQLDRFLMRLSIGYPDNDAEREILQSQMMSHPLNDISYVIKAMDVVRCHSLVRNIHVSEKIRDYIIKISSATREHPALTNGCSPRASLALMRVSQSLAAYYGRDFVLPRDVREMVKPVLSHRVRLKLRYQGEWKGVNEVLDNIIQNIPMENEDQGI